MDTLHYLILSLLLFIVGAVGFIMKKNIISIFLCLELMLNAVNLSFVAFSQAAESGPWPDIRFLCHGGCRGGSRRRAGNHDRPL